MFRYTHRLARLLSLCLMCLCLLDQAGARAGGAGGHSSGGSSGGSSHSYGGGSYGGSGFNIHSPSYYGGGGSSGGFGMGSFLIILIFIVVVIIMWKNSQNNGSGVTAEPIDEVPNETAALAQIRQIDPNFNLNEFRQKVARAFTRIQQAWSAQDISKARIFISDGIYQRYTTQFQMMRLLQQQNQLSDIQIHMIQPVASFIDGAYQVMDVKISASMMDQFVCQLDDSLNESGDGIFTEYWTFLRRIDSSKHGSDLTNSANCPSCGAALPPSMGEICRCEHCQVMINSGEFDWILCEITQEEDYGAKYFPQESQPDLDLRLANLCHETPDFSIALSEDKASNAMMQIFSALSTDQPQQVRRFVSDDTYQKLINQRPQPPVVYSRLFLNDVSLLAVNRSETRHQLRFGIALTRQRAQVLGNRRLQMIDFSPDRTYVLMDLERETSATPPVGALYQHQCPNCGGAVADTTDTRCVYCGSELNSPSYEWIVTGIQSQSQL